MTGDRLLQVAGRLTAVGGALGIAAGVAQITVGSRIPGWSGNKAQPVSLGLLTVALCVSVVVAAGALRATTRPGSSGLAAITLWLAVVVAVCSTTVGRLWALPGVILAAAAAVTLAACGWHRFRSVVATNWLRGLLGVLGALELLMAVSAGPARTVVVGIIAGGSLIAAAVRCRPGRQMLIAVFVGATLPFAALTWWTIVTPLITVVALAIGLAVVGGARTEARPVRATRTPSGSVT